MDGDLAMSNEWAGIQWSGAEIMNKETLITHHVKGKHEGETVQTN